MKPKVDVDGTGGGPLEELVRPEHVLQSEEVDIGAESHLAHAVGVEVKLILDDLSKVLEKHV